MSTDNRDICIRLNQDVFGAGRVELVDDLVAPHFTEHAGPPGTPAGPDAVRRTVKFLHGAFDDIEYAIEDTVAEGDRVVLRVSMSATHARGEFMGIPATGKRFAVSQIHVFRLDDGKVAEHWATRDDMSMMRQLGRGE